MIKGYFFCRFGVVFKDRVGKELVVLTNLISRIFNLKPLRVKIFENRVGVGFSAPTIYVVASFSTVSRR